MKVQSKVQTFPAMGSVLHDDGYFINEIVLKIANKIIIREQGRVCFISGRGIDRGTIGGTNRPCYWASASTTILLFLSEGV